MWGCALWVDSERRCTAPWWSTPAVLKPGAPGSADRYLRVLWIQAGSHLQGGLDRVQLPVVPPLGVSGWLMGTGKRFRGLRVLCCLLFDPNISGEPPKSPQKWDGGKMMEKPHQPVCYHTGPLTLCSRDLDFFDNGQPSIFPIFAHAPAAAYSSFLRALA